MIGLSKTNIGYPDLIVKSGSGRLPVGALRFVFRGYCTEVLQAFEKPAALNYTCLTCLLWVTRKAGITDHIKS